MPTDSQLKGKEPNATILNPVTVSTRGPTLLYSLPTKGIAMAIAREDGSRISPASMGDTPWIFCRKTGVISMPE
ncbi:hypothetical protein D3C75_932580 [compost metagenome]